ncbi:MAG: helix-turn-helix domain-containing protein [Tannerella sp.]|jgi:DNA-binding XRE family transcriptional regulator|nr:helix-turn-helix domain-containing protein [Tannerella sp.]
MIHNKKQLTQAEKTIEELRKKIAGLGTVLPESLELLQKVAWEKRMNDLDKEIAEFNFLKQQSVLTFSSENLEKLIMSLRIAAGFTQKKLAEAIEVKEQQIQRYEQTQYLTASFDRIIQILKKLSEDFELKIFLKKNVRRNTFSNIRKLYPNIHQIQDEVKKRHGLFI